MPDAGGPGPPGGPGALDGPAWLTACKLSSMPRSGPRARRPAPSRAGQAGIAAGSGRRPCLGRRPPAAREAPAPTPPAACPPLLQGVVTAATGAGVTLVLRRALGGTGMGAAGLGQVRRRCPPPAQLINPLGAGGCRPPRPTGPQVCPATPAPPLLPAAHRQGRQRSVCSSSFH